MADDNKWRWWVLVTVIFGTFLGRVDQTVVNLALPKMITDFSVTVTDAAWISTAYILANAVFVPVWGKLGDWKSTRLNSSHQIISYAVFCLKKKKSDHSSVFGRTSMCKRIVN